MTEVNKADSVGAMLATLRDSLDSAEGYLKESRTEQLIRLEMQHQELAHVQAHRDNIDRANAAHAARARAAEERAIANDQTEREKTAAYVSDVQHVKRHREVVEEVARDGLRLHERSTEALESIAASLRALAAEKKG